MNQNSTIERNELALLLKKIYGTLGIDPPSESDIDNEYKRLDKNSDGKLNKEEFKILVKELAEKVQPTDWSTLKTEAIDFDEPFVWFDDYEGSYEIERLKEHNLEDSFYLVDRNDPNAAKEMLQYLEERNHESK